MAIAYNFDVNVDWKENFIVLDNGVKMAYMTSGPTDGTPLLLIHGATDNRYSWAQLVPILSNAGYRCYVPELRGHGASTKANNGGVDYKVEVFTEDIINFLEKLNIENLSVIGHSLGSFILQELLITAPEKIHKGILIGSGSNLKNNLFLDWLVTGGYLEVADMNFEGIHSFKESQTLPEPFLELWAMTTNEDSEFAKAIYDNAKSLPYETWAGVFSNALQFNNDDRLSNISQDLLLIWGDDDLFFNTASRDHFISKFTKEKILSLQIEGGSHNVHWDSKESCSTIGTSIIEFLVR